MAKNGEVSTRQRKMILAMQSSRTIGQACEAAGCGRTTLSRWLHDNPAFSQALKLSQATTIGHANSRLIAAQDKAITTLIDLSEHARNEATKRAASVDLLSFSLRFIEVVDTEQRLSDLESEVFTNGN